MVVGGSLSLDGGRRRGGRVGAADRTRGEQASTSQRVSGQTRGGGSLVHEVALQRCESR